MYHWRAGTWRLESKLLHIHTSHCSCGTNEDVTVTESLWCCGGYRQGGLGTTVVYVEPKSQVRVCFHVKDNVPKLMEVLSERLKKRVIIYSSGIALDVLPQGAGKGQALAYLLKKFEVDGKLPISTLVCGDFGNDIKLFSILKVHGVMNNCKIIHATERCAAGIIQAIGSFGLGPNVSPRDIRDFRKCKVQIVNPGYEVVKFSLFYERWKRAKVEKSEEQIENLKSKFVILAWYFFFFHLYGFERPIHQCIHTLKSLHGGRLGKQFLVWVDRAFLAQIGSDTWLVKFEKWESSAYLCLDTLSFFYIHLNQTGP
ncbi:hypothetical protein UlMin_017177 [Ulmus minor]